MKSFLKIPFDYNGGGFNVWFEGMLFQVGKAYGGYIVAHWSTWEVIKTDPRFVDLLIDWPTKENLGPWYDEANNMDSILWRSDAGGQLFNLPPRTRVAVDLLLTRMEEEAR